MLRKWENLKAGILAKSIGKTTETRDKAAQTTVLFPDNAKIQALRFSELPSKCPQFPSAPSAPALPGLCIGSPEEIKLHESLRRRMSGIAGASINAGGFNEYLCSSCFFILVGGKAYITYACQCVVQKGRGPGGAGALGGTLLGSSENLRVRMFALSGKQPLFEQLYREFRLFSRCF